MLKIFNNHYTQASAAKKLGVSRNTIVNDEKNMREESFEWMDSMSSGDFVMIIKNWFTLNMQHISEFSSKISHIDKATPKQHALLMSILSPAIDGLDKKNRKYVLDILNAYGDESKSVNGAGALTLYRNTISNVISQTNNLIIQYPILKGLKEYKDFLGLKGAGDFPETLEDVKSLEFMKHDKSKSDAK